MDSHEALPGTRVRVREGAYNTKFAGMWGAIERCFGSPEHRALEVRLENGRHELFWFYQLDSPEAWGRYVAAEHEDLEEHRPAASAGC